MRRLALLSILLWAPLALAQVEPEPSAETPAGGLALQDEGAAATGRTPASEYTDPAEVDFIGRINDAIDTRADATESGEQPRSSGVTEGLGPEGQGSRARQFPVWSAFGNPVFRKNRVSCPVAQIP